jgi:hypothetical protein
MLGELSGSVHDATNLVGGRAAVNPQWRDTGHADALQPASSTASHHAIIPGRCDNVELRADPLAPRNDR